MESRIEYEIFLNVSYLDIEKKSNEAFRLAGGAQRPILRPNEPEKSGVRTAQRGTLTNLLI
jgi:hypothetical protein